MVSTTPAGLKIRPRHMDFDFPNPLPRHWHSGDAFKSHLFDSMSVLFPDGERFFIDSVRKFRDQISGPELSEQIRGFIGQEGHHSREHLVYSDRLRDLGYDITRMENRAKKRIHYTQKKFSAKRQLAATAAMEHITAIMADGLLRNEKQMEGAHPLMRQLWRWHALEETEHKAVAFDVYNQVGGDRKILHRAMRIGTFFFIKDTFLGLAHMLKQDGLLWNWRIWRDGLRWMWGKEGVFRPMIKTYKDFFKEDFHPWQHNNIELLYAVRVEFDETTEPAAA